DRHADRALCACSAARERAGNDSARHGVSAGGNGELPRWPVMVATDVSFQFGPRVLVGSLWTRGTDDWVFGCAAAPLAGAFGISGGYRAPICTGPITVSIVAGRPGECRVARRLGSGRKNMQKLGQRDHANRCHAR